MRGLENNFMGRVHSTDRHTDRQTIRLLDQLGPEGRVGENPVHGRHRISRPMWIVAPIPQWGGPRIHKNKTKNFKLKKNPKPKNSKNF